MFDLNLYSDSLGKYITKLDDGKFEVRIPVPDNFKGKNLTVYYVDENGILHMHGVYEFSMPDKDRKVFYYSTRRGGTKNVENVRKLYQLVIY